MSSRAKYFAFVAALMLAACSRSGEVPSSPTNAAASNSTAVTAQSIVTKGAFSEYSLPAGINPSDLTRGPYNTIWFTHPGESGAPPVVYEMADGTGAVRTFTAPPAYQSGGFDSIISLNRSVYFILKQPIEEDIFFFARVTPEGTFTFQGAPYFEFGIVTNLALSFSGTSFVYGWCIDPCQGPNNGQAAGASLTDFFAPTAITGGPNGVFYAGAVQRTPNGTPTDSRIYVISGSGTLVNTVNLPNGSDPAGIATGPDHNLWITEPGINKIARMTPAGALAQFSLPTAHAGPDRITEGYDGAMFFTESNVNKIGRITTAGGVTEYSIPTAGSKPTGIAPCSSTNCGTHGGVWFTETAANKIGRFNAPI